ncbi:hypothetical protein C7S18_14625 [Ahniella affigens]|uniref:Type I restriction modification DNA specificity domain-containing protein n=1 Tax=Ahniella affigens TaxID=2021234 RepID=A0A2P1PU27_9GAMM|nr:restriction endonuclease subunit S [Ahniella affigens]AVP98347.1 hypothetical protein C7S18_14625 [Ahniella affigens]
MKLETFFEKFDQFADAPDGVAKMRELVLHFAFSGKLLPAESEWPLKPLKSLATKIGSGATPAGGRESYFTEGIPLIRSMNVHFAGFEHKGLVFLSDEQAKQLANVNVQPGDVLLNITGASIGRVTTAPLEMAGARVNQHVAIIRTIKELDTQFLARFLASPVIQRMIDEVQVGATREALTKGMIEQFNIPLPTLAEQKRIVAKVDELMALCDRLEAQQQERETRHAALARASLARFADAPTPANLSFLFHPSYGIPPAELRKSILDLAVCGKLAAPAPDDGEIRPIEEFREAAATLADTLGLRSPKESLDEAQPPFDVPAHWRWMVLADLGAAQTGTTPSKNNQEAFNGDIPFIKPAAILPDGIDYSSESLTRHGAQSGSRLAPAGSLLMVCIGTIGKCNLIERECAFNQQINSLSPVQWVDSQYLLLAVRAPYFQDAAWKKSSSTTIPILNKGKWLSISVPIPPLAEQRRIVARVAQLMALVDALETQLATASTTAANLLTALVAELTTQD